MTISPRLICAIAAGAIAVVLLLTADLGRNLILVAVAIILLAIGLVVT